MKQGDFEIRGTTLVKYRGDDKTVIVPDGIEVIGESAFFDMGNIVSVILPASVKVIESRAFLCCENLASVNIPYGVEVIAEATFQECSNLNNIFLPDTVTEIQKVAFSGCKSLDSLHISENISEIGEDAFGFISYKNAPWKEKQGNNFPIVGDGVLLAYPKDSENLVIPYGVKHIPAILSDSAREIKSIQIPETVITISPYFLWECLCLEEFSVAENNPHYCSIDNVLYSNDRKILDFYPPERTGTVFEIPDTVEVIQQRTFLHTKNLKTIVIPESVKIIGQNIHYSTFREGLQLQFKGQWDGFTLPILKSWKFSGMERFLNCLQSPSFETFRNIDNKIYRLYFVVYLYQKNKDERYQQIIFDDLYYTTEFLLFPEQINLLNQFLECEFFGMEQIDYLLEKAIEQKIENTEIVLLLLEYKNQHSGYIAPEEHFKL